MCFTTSLTVCVILSMCWDLKVESLEKRHSLHYMYTALSKNVSAPGIFDFTAMGLLDDRKIDYYNSRDKVKIPEQDWMKEKLPAEYWTYGTEARKSKEQWFKSGLNILMERMRHNKSDIHVHMWRGGCDVISMPDGSLKFDKGVYEFSYDGKDFLYFDVDSTQWVAPVNAALATKRMWDNDTKLNSHLKGYLEIMCVRWLGDFRRYRDEKENQTDPPKIHLFAKDAQFSDTFKLTCMATGLYSKNTEISILKSGWSVAKGYPHDFLPNDDGTYQIRLTVDAKKSEIDDYGCEVNHGDQKNTLVWPKDGIFSAKAPSSIGWWWPFLLVVLGVLLLLLVVILGVICVKEGIMDINRNGNGTSANGSAGEGSTEIRVEQESLLEGGHVAVKKNTDSISRDSGTGRSTGLFEGSSLAVSTSSSMEEMNSVAEGLPEGNIPDLFQDEMYFLPTDEDQERAIVLNALEGKSYK